MSFTLIHCEQRPGSLVVERKIRKERKDKKKKKKHELANMLDVHLSSLVLDFDQAEVSPRGFDIRY